MLQKGNFYFILLILFSFSCGVNQKEEETDRDFNKRDVYIKKQFPNYSKVYTEVNDSIEKWMLNNLAIVKYDVVNPYFKIDSIFIFNKDSTMFFTMHNKQDVRHRNAVMDYISSFGGRKINGKWYFFFSGTSTVLPRAGLQDSTYAPFSFEELSYLAYDQEFKPYVKNILEGHPEKNEQRFYTDYADIQECPKTNKKLDWKCIDSLIVLSNTYIYNGKMTKEEIAEIQKAIDESVRPPEPKKEIKQWWQFWKDEPQTPIFETEEWKNYLKQKYGSKWQEHL